MSERLPTIYHGVPDNADDMRIVDDALNEIVARINGVPGHLAMRLICSVMVTVCAAQNDPGRVFQTIGVNVAKALNDVMDMDDPEGNA